MVLPDTIFKVQIRNICHMFPTKGQGCQLLSKFIDDMDNIVIINLCHVRNFEFFQVLATVGNKAECFST